MTTIEQLRRKADQHWELAGLARLDRDFVDEARHMGLARELERRIREMKVFGEADVAERDRLKERVAALEREREELKHDLERYISIASEEATRAEDAEARLAEALKALAEVRRRARNIWGACSSDQIIDKDVERQAKLMLEYIDTCLEKGNSDGE